MKCENKVDVWVESGYHGKTIEFPCGMTGPHGTVELCDTCTDTLNKRYPQGWRHHPGDTCKHGTYLNPSHDCCCAACENGEPAPSEYKCHCGARLEFVMGYEDEIDCPRCDMTVSLPETEEKRVEWLAEIDKEIEAVKYTGKIRIMRIDECGHESCVVTVSDDNTLQYVLAGVEATYPESRVFTEPEENSRYIVEQMLLDE
jgi:hypothetical protein